MAVGPSDNALYFSSRCELQQRCGIFPENRVAAVLRNIKVLDETYRPRLQRGQRWSIAAVNYARWAQPFEHHFEGGLVIGNAVDMDHPEIIARLSSDLHRHVGTEKEGLVTQFIGIVHPADGLADSTAAVRRDELHVREVLEDAANDKAAEGQA